MSSTDHLAPYYVVFSTPVTSSLLASNILLSTLFSNSLSLRSFLCASDQVSHPHKTTDKITVLYTLIFIFLDSGRQKILHQMANICSLQSALNFFLNGILVLGCSKMFELYHPFKGFIICLDINVLII